MAKRDSSQRRLDDAALVTVIRIIFKASRETYDSPRVCATFQEQGFRDGQNRVTRLVREITLVVLPKHGFRVSTPKADPEHVNVFWTLN